MNNEPAWSTWIQEREDPRSSARKPEALDDLVVLDVSTGSMSGVFCTSLLAEFGAEVIRVEPPGGDVMRIFTPFGIKHRDTGLGYLVEGRNKLHVTLDLQHETGRAILSSLARRADVLVETFRPGEADGLGIGYRQLSALNPQLIYAAISTYGQWGPEASRQKAKRDREVADQALSGLVQMTGEPASESESNPGHTRFPPRPDPGWAGTQEASGPRSACSLPCAGGRSVDADRWSTYQGPRPSCAGWRTWLPTTRRRASIGRGWACWTPQSSRIHSCPPLTATP